ncbi:acetyl-CoA C-acetyltransferase [Arthrobacter sp. SLBN-112]|jgi:acetyl-CoA C-acetyltransferase|uniref:thiolase family protein n=1 Tax=Arthrobacter sp. SLBN-112 TaxID=2768452 RepID=UPI00114EDD96|nr:acetyl-CoA C-acyltransferase [Arthrobacter sp. SLBN-112]TQJ38521.1 acetyl-CoA C-acetyltransferase [Arthrobacter sp. SLBN-112]
MPEAFLVGGVRTPVGRYGGALASVRPDDLAALVLHTAVARAGVDPAMLDEVILGCVNQAGEDNRNVARMAALLAGFPHAVPAVTVNRLCASGLTAVSMAAQSVRNGDADIVLAGGVESMTRAPWVMAKPGKPYAKPGELADTSIGARFVNPRMESGALFSMPETAEEVAGRENISRADADGFALRSHSLAVAAIDAGRFTDEIVPVPVKGSRGETKVVDTDEGPRRGSTAESLAALQPIVTAGGVVTAGNSSSLNDGASAVLVASGEAVERHGLTPRARIITSQAAGVAPEVMGIGPVPATQKALDKAGWSLADVGAIELNEAFAAQALACMRLLGMDAGIVNNDGGAIALGHPLGSSGSRILITLLGRMERENANRGLATMCVGLGQGVAMLLERV